MITPEPTPREMLAQLEATAEHEDEIMRRAIEALRTMIDDREAIDSLCQRAIQVQIARTGYLVELTALARQETGCEIIHLSPLRRPKPRAVQ
ncbi:Hypothetical protein NGAL_HAMBI2605_59440 [Neorhizobium galegae bv. orientalis]|nr:Hypothetical protein NGAL_HAMBI2605_59440 [Neorhizobium galegae bv. orientalis]